jgi:hypothetical protein
MLRSISHRVRQFIGALHPRVTGDDRAEAYRWLTPAQCTLFESMTLRDQQHGIVVLRKGRITLWQRVAHVLLSAVPPAIEAGIASEGGAGWRQAFWRLREHPRLGAEMVAAAGADAETARLIREQDAASPDARLAILQSADSA